MGKIVSLQVMRGIAALFVVMFHYSGFLGQGSVYQNVYHSLFSWGIVGVDIFFVISGFIMIYTTHNKKHGITTAKKFFANRLLRVLPVYYFGLLVAFAVGGAMSLFHYPEKLTNLISALTFTVYRNDITPHYIDDGGLYNIRWTLNYELYFYVVFSLCLFFRYRALALATWGVLAIIVVPSLAGFTPTLSMQGYAWHNPWFGFLTNPIILEFLIGVFFAYLYIGITKQVVAKEIKFIFALFAICILLYLGFRLFMGTLFALYIPTTLLIGIVIFSLCISDSLISKYIPRFLEVLGDISYSLYLLHSLVGIFVFKKLGKLHDGDLYRVFVVIVALTLSVIAAYYSHKYVEIKFVNFLKRKLGLIRTHPLPGNPVGTETAQS